MKNKIKKFRKRIDNLISIIVLNIKDFTNPRDELHLFVVSVVIRFFIFSFIFYSLILLFNEIVNDLDDYSAFDDDDDDEDWFSVEIKLESAAVDPKVQEVAKTEYFLYKDIIIIELKPTLDEEQLNIFMEMIGLAIEDLKLADPIYFSREEIEELYNEFIKAVESPESGGMSRDILKELITTKIAKRR